MIDQLGQCDYMYFQWSMIKSQRTPITKGGTSQSNLHWTFFTQLLLHTVTGSILNSYTDLPFFTGHLGPFSHLGIKIMAWWTNQSQGCSLLIRYQTFAWKNFIERLDCVKKLINICSSRGFSIHGKVTIIKSLIISKFVYFPCFWWSPRKSLKS